jgi:hypothetical protein
LEPTVLFQGELMENLTKVDDILNILIHFKYNFLLFIHAFIRLHNYYLFYEIIYRRQFKIVQTEYLPKKFENFISKNIFLHKYVPRYWNFHTNDVFGNLNAFEDRLNCIKVCKTL